MPMHMYGTGIAQMGSQVLQKELCLTYLVEEAQKVVLICSLDLFELKQQVLPCLAVLGHPETTCIHSSVISHCTFIRSSLHLGMFNCRLQDTEA
jgi:hypothetical protein